jgi:hypothetical protein
MGFGRGEVLNEARGMELALCVIWLAMFGVRGFELDDCGLEFLIFELDDCEIELDDCAIELDDCGTESSDCAIESSDCAIELDDCGIESSDCAIELDDCGIEVGFFALDGCGIGLGFFELDACGVEFGFDAEACGPLEIEFELWGVEGGTRETVLERFVPWGVEMRR